MAPFVPLFRNPHLATMAGNFWPRPPLDSWPVDARVCGTEPDVQVLVHTQEPLGEARGDLLLVHGLEGSSDAGYARSMAYAALSSGFSVHRINLRSCGNTEHLALSNYHSGQTCDVLHVARAIHARHGRPLYLCGYSLGGNIVLKLAGELGDDARGWIHGIAAVSTPIDLAACADRLGKTENFIYAWRFLSRLKEKIRRRHGQAPEIYSLEPLARIRTIWEFDDLYTAKLFEFGTAVNYYGTQSSRQYMGRIRVPALIIAAKDDPLVPFEVYDHPAFRANGYLRLLAPDHGGHLGFLAKRRPRFWLDEVVVHWMNEIGNKITAGIVGV